MNTTITENRTGFDNQALNDAVRAAQDAYLTELAENSASAILTQATVQVWAAGASSVIQTGISAAAVTGAVLTAGSPLMYPLIGLSVTSGIRALLSGVGCYQAVQYRGALKRGEEPEVDVLKDAKHSTYWAALGLTLDVADTAIFASIPFLGGPSISFVGAGFSAVRTLFGTAQTINGIRAMSVLEAVTVVEEETEPRKPGAHKVGQAVNA